MRRLLVVMGAAALSACSQVPGPSLAAPDTPPAFDAAHQPAAGEATPDTEWRTVFGDARLRALIEAALVNNRDLRVATERIAEAAAQRRIARADRFPTVDLRASAQFGEGQGAGQGQAGGGAVQPGGDPSQPPDGDPNQPGQDPTQPQGGGSGAGQRYRVNLAVTAFELDFWGRVRSLEAAALARYLATVEAQQAFRLSLIADLAEAYFSERELDERGRLAAETIASRQRSLYLARRLFEEGEGSELEVQQELALLADAEGQYAALQAQVAQARNLLRLLVGGPLPENLPPPRQLSAPDLVASVQAGLPSDLLLRRPDIRQAEQNLRAAEADVGSARAALFPRITLTAALGFASNELGRLFSDESDFWSASPNLNLPLFDAGRRRGEIQAAQARRRIAVAEYERTVQIAFREVADALAGRRYFANQLAAQRTSRDAQARRLRLAELRFAAGESTAIDVLEARRQIFIADQNLLATRRAQVANDVSLYTALGGGLR